MTVKLVSNEKVAATSSKGNQEKWFDKETNKWYKLDQFGYEALTETIISKLLEKSNIESDTPFSFARYEMELRIMLLKSSNKDMNERCRLFTNFSRHAQILKYILLPAEPRSGVIIPTISEELFLPAQ